MVEQTLEGSNAKALCFTAVSNTGVPCWGYKLQPKFAIAYNYTQYSSTYFKRTMFSRVTSDKDILFTPEENVTLSWMSSNPEVLSNTGKFTAPAEDTSFTMTARMECGNFYWQRDFSAKAIADPSSISEVSMSEQVNKCSNDVFDLMGRRVEKPSRGFYLVNGKKVWFQ